MDRLTYSSTMLEFSRALRFVISKLRILRFYDLNNFCISVRLKFELLTETQFFKQHMRTNFLGTVYCTKSVVDTMKSRRTGRIVFISSQAGQIGIFGYTAYSPTKFALKGFSECLQMELKPYNVYMTLVYPPDVDTPGLKEENLQKPLETKLIADESGVLKPEDVASQAITAIQVSLCTIKPYFRTILFPRYLLIALYE
jgi:short-subunit dehydrogenase